MRLYGNALIRQCTYCDGGNQKFSWELLEFWKQSFNSPKNY